MHEPHSSGVRRITHFVRGEVVMNECLLVLTSFLQLVAVRFARRKALRRVLCFHLSGMDDFQCTCNFPGF